MSTDREPARMVRLKCRLCGITATFRLPWQGRPQGPQCQCNPNTWGNWRALTEAERAAAAMART